MDIIKIFVYKVIRTCIRFFAFFPIKKNRLLFESYKGNSYSCNPKYICEYLMKNHKNMYEIIWILNSPDKATLPPKIKTVKKKSIANFYYHLTAKVIITNMTDDVYIPKRKEQIIINTWHAGGAYKKVGLSYDKTNSILMKWQNKIVRDETSYYVSSSELFSKYNIQDAYHTEFKEHINPKEGIIVTNKLGEELTEETIIATGMKLKAEELEFELVVIGDVNESGGVTTTDLAQLKLHYIGEEILTGARFKAADIDGNNKITITDLAKLKLMLIGEK